MNQIINDLLTVLNGIGSGFCNHAVSMFAQSGVLIILLLIIDFMLRKKVRAVFRYFVWMLVFIKLILPPTLSLPTGIGYWCGSSLSPKKIISKQITDKTSTAESIMPDMSENSAINSEPAQARPFQTTPATIAPVGSVVTGLHSISWQAIVFLIWLVGVLVFSVLLIQRLFFVLGLIAQSEPAQPGLLETLNHCRRQVSIGRNIKLKLSHNIQSPAVCGLVRQVILLPTSLPEELSNDKLRAVLIHELVHIKRFDLWVNFAQTFLQIIYFYNPFVWLANAVVRRLREQAVDETVLVTLGAEAKSYSNTLIDIAELAFFRASFGLRLIGVAESKKSLHRRIRHLLSRPIPKSAKIGVSGVVIIITLAAILLPMAGRIRGAAIGENSVQDDSDTQLMLAWWMAAVEEPFASKLASMSEPLSTESKTYRAYQVSSDDLLELFTHNQNSGDVIFVSRVLQWLDPSPRYRRASSWSDTDNLKHPVFVGYGTGAAGPYKMDIKTNAVILDLEHETVSCTLNSGSSIQGSIFFKDRLEPDQALVYLAKMPEKDNSRPCHIVIYQAVEVSNERVSFVRGIQNAREWVKLETKPVSSLPFIATLPNGVTVELLAVCEYEGASTEWWRPDGTELAKKILIKKTGTVVASGKDYVVAIKVKGPEDISLKWGKIKGGTRLVSLEVVDSQGQAISNMRAQKVNIDEKLTTTSIRLGVAAGDWETKAEHNGKGMKSLGIKGGGVAFSEAYQSNGIVKINVSDDCLNLNHRIIAIDKEGTEHVPQRQTWTSVGKVRQTMSGFHNLTLNQIREFQYQVRPYDWAEFKNVSLKPGVTTDVEIGYEFADAQAAPAVKSRRIQPGFTSEQGSEAKTDGGAAPNESRHGSVSGTARIHGTEVPASGVVVKTISKWFETVQARTDEQGNYTLSGIVPEAVFHITAEDEQKELYVINMDMPAVVLKPGEAKTGVDLRLYQGLKGSISGKVLGRRVFYQKPERLTRNIVPENFERREDTPLGGVKIILREGKKSLEETITDEMGRYRFEGLRAGHYSVWALKPAGTAIEMAWTVPMAGQGSWEDHGSSYQRGVDVKLEPQTDVDLHFRLDGVSIAGRVTDDNGNPISGAIVVIELCTPTMDGGQGRSGAYSKIKISYGMVRTKTDKDGGFKMDGFCPVTFSETATYLIHGKLYRRYEVRIQAEGYSPARLLVPPVTEHLVGETSRLMEDYKGLYGERDSSSAEVALPETSANTITGIDIVLEKEAVIMGQVVDTQGNILAGPGPRPWIRMVCLDSGDDKDESLLVQMPDRTNLNWIALDEAGCFKFDSVSAGNYFFEIKAGEYSYDTQRARNEPLEVKAGDIIKDLDVIVESAADRGNISGRVLDSLSGKPFKAFSVIVTGVDSPGESTPSLGHVKMDGLQKGDFLVEGLSPGTATLEIWSFGSVREKARVKVVSGQTTDRTFHLESGGKISGRVLDARTRKPIETISVKVISVEPSGENTPANGQVTIDKSQGGAFLIEGVSPGTATVQILASGYASEKAHVKVVSGQTTERTFHLEQEGKLHVYTTLNGEGKMAWVVNARPVGEGSDAEISTQMGKNGFYELTGLKEGEYMISAPVPLKTGRRGQATVQINNRAKVKIESGKETRLNFELRENAGIRGSFTCPDKDLSWRILVFDDSVRIGEDSVSEVKQAHALVWNLEKGEYYEITCLPAGTYMVVGRCCKKEQGWTPVMEKSKTVTLNDGQIIEVDFAFQ